MQIDSPVVGLSRSALMMVQVVIGSNALARVAEILSSVTVSPPADVISPVSDVEDGGALGRGGQGGPSVKGRAYIEGLMPASIETLRTLFNIGSVSTSGSYVICELRRR